MRKLFPLAVACMVAWSLGHAQTAYYPNFGKKPSHTYPPPPKGVIRINVGAEPPDLDPNLITDVNGGWVANHLFETLVRIDAEAKVHPAQAESWEHDETYTVWTFHLRKDNHWHNGEPVTARDFEYSLRRIMTPATTAQYATMVYTFIKGGPEFYDSGGANTAGLGVETLDDHTLRITTRYPTPYFLSLLNHSAWAPLHRPTVEKFGPEWVRAQNLVGNGPYRLKEHRPKDVIVLEKADTFWDKANVHFRTIEFKIITDAATEMAAFVSGDLDVTGQMPIREAPQWFNEPEFFRGPSIAVQYVGFNVTKPPFDDPALRKAFALTVNRQLIVERITRRGELPATGFIPRGLATPDGRDYRDVLPGYYTGEFAESVKKAKEILKGAGYAIDGQQGKPLPRATYIYNTDDTNKRIAEMLQAVWKSTLGADVKLENMEWTVLLSRLRQHDYQFSRSSWFGDYLDPMTFLEMFETGGGQNRLGYSNPRYDELLNLIRSETDPAKRLEQIREAEELLVEKDCALAPIYFYVWPALHRTEIRGIVQTPLGGLDVTRAWREGE